MRRAPGASGSGDGHRGRSFSFLPDELPGEDCQRFQSGLVTPRPRAGAIPADCVTLTGAPSPPPGRGLARASLAAHPNIRVGCPRPLPFLFLSPQRSAFSLVVVAAGPLCIPAAGHTSAGRQPFLRSGRLRPCPHDSDSGASGPRLGVRLRCRMCLPPPPGGAARPRPAGLRPRVLLCA